MVKLIAMDMDGTITQHKSKLEEKNREILYKLKEKYKVVIIGAGVCERIHKQLELDGIDIIGSYGMQVAEVVNDQLKLIQKSAVEVDKESVSQRVEKLRAKYHYEEYVGESVEFHETGMVTIPLLGTAAKLEDKLAFDPNREKRRKFYQYVKELFPEYMVFVGGTSSFDMAPSPYNKLYALESYAKLHEIENSEIVYLGDDYGLGGNDEHIYKSNIKFVCVDSYLDFAEKVKEYL